MRLKIFKFIYDTDAGTGCDVFLSEKAAVDALYEAAVSYGYSGPIDEEAISEWFSQQILHADTHFIQEDILELEEGVCGRCYDEGVLVLPAECAYRPEIMENVAIGQYHCPDCGAMVMAGVKHPKVCATCRDKKHPGFDGPLPEENSNEPE
jgi:hypothetical protein